MRRLLTPRWLLGHLFVVCAFVACLYLGWWQLSRFESDTGGPQNLAYALQWPVFAAFGLWFWWRAVRDQLAMAPGEKLIVKVEPPRRSAEVEAKIRRDEEADPVLAEYNRYLARLNSRD